MVLDSGASSFMSLLLSLVIFAAMRLFSETLSSSQLLTILGGFLGSLIFVLLITFVNNLERKLFGDEFCCGVFPEGNTDWNLMYLKWSRAFSLLVHCLQLSIEYAAQRGKILMM
ncbi:unnamed protein product [Schistosoma turkestanicum]|nr:unnamed protein product [Schistosoma turkestanicum]